MEESHGRSAGGLGVTNITNHLWMIVFTADAKDAEKFFYFAPDPPKFLRREKTTKNKRTLFLIKLTFALSAPLR